MYKQKIGQKIAIISLLAIGTGTFIENISTYSNTVLAAKSSDTKTKSTKSSSTKSSDTKTKSANSSNTKSSDSSSSSNSSSDESPSGSQNPTEIPDSTLNKPSSYPYWLQYWGSWAHYFGDKGTGGKNWTYPSQGKSNTGCVVTSQAIQMARGGFTKKSDGGDFNPSFNPTGYGGTSYDADGLHMSTTPVPEGVGQHLSASEALKAAQKIASAGDYPLIRTSQISNDAYQGSHSVAYWKAGNGKPLVYDPSRAYNGDIQRPSYAGVTALKITGKGAKKFSEDSPGPNNANSKDSKSNDSKSNDSSSGSGSSSSSKIKPIFNPFYSPAVKYIPADQQNNQSQTNAQVMQTADGMLPTVLGSLRVFVGFTAYVYAMLAIVAILIALADLQLGGVLQDKFISKSGPMTKALFMPGGKFMGVDDNQGTVVSGKNPALTIVMNGTKHYAALLIILTLVASGSMSWIIGNSIALIGNLFGLG